MNISPEQASQFVSWFRDAAPYIKNFRNRTFVIYFDGELLLGDAFYRFAHDLTLLHSLGAKVVLVHGAKPQIAERLAQSNADMPCEGSHPVVDEKALKCIKESCGSIRLDIEAILSSALQSSPMAGANIRIASGNFVFARPMGILEGVDHKHHGGIRRVDAEGIHHSLDGGNMVLLSPIGYSPTGEVFSLEAEDLATEAAIALKADKIIYLQDTPGICDDSGELMHEVTLSQLNQMLQQHQDHAQLLKYVAKACAHGVNRAHLINHHTDGAILLELFTRDGIGTLITAEEFEDVRPATINDVVGILELLEPLENAGVLVKRSREKLEMEIDHFFVDERDSKVIACGAFYPYGKENMAELACLAVHPDYQKEGRGEALLNLISQQAKQHGIEQLFVLTTQTAHWFIERGFDKLELEQLPIDRQNLYNYQRNSAIYVRTI